MGGSTRQQSHPGWESVVRGVAGYGAGMEEADNVQELQG